MKRLRFRLPRFSIRALLVLTVVAAWLAWDLGRQRAYDHAVEQFALLFPGSFIETEEPTGIRTLQSRLTRLVGIPVYNRQVTMLEIYPEDPTMVVELSQKQARLFAELPPTRTIQLSNFDFSLKDVSFRFRKDSLNTLCLSGCRLRNSSLRDLRLPFLHSLHLESCQSLDGLDSIGDTFPNLRRLHLGNCERFGNIPAVLKSSKQIGSIVLSGPSITDNALLGIECLEGLTGISVSDSPITDVCLNKIGQLTKLNSVSFIRTSISSGTTSNLAKLPRLEKILLSTNNGITDEAITQLRGMSQLRSLQILDEPYVTDRSAEVIGSLSDLTELEMTGTRVGRKTIQQIAQLQKLSTLTIESDELYVDDILPLASGRIESIRYRWREPPNRIYYGASLTRNQLRFLAGLEASQDTTIELHRLKGLTRAHFKAWPQNVSRVSLHGCQLDSTVLEELATRTKTLALDLSSTNVDSKMLECISALRNLQELDLADCPNIDESALNLIHQLPVLVQLNVKGTRITVNVPLRRGVESN